MTLLDEIIEQREWSGLFQPSIDLKGSDWASKV
jgi:hypothetical protein